MHEKDIRSRIKLFFSAERILRTEWAHFRIDLNHFIRAFQRWYIGSLVLGTAAQLLSNYFHAGKFSGFFVFN